MERSAETCQGRSSPWLSSKPITSMTNNFLHLWQ
uniref:Uncharacterized protein n=1 Tax=Arundo donax TaxID=35708 RepID=A0A0A8Z7Q3_ARUDO